MYVQRPTGSRIFKFLSLQVEANVGVSHEGAAVRLLLRPEEAAATLGVSRSRMFELLASGAIPSIRIGRSRRIPLSEIERWIESEIAAQCG